MRDAPQRQRRQIVKRLARAPLVELTAPGRAPQRRENLEVDELRRDQLLTP